LQIGQIPVILNVSLDNGLIDLIALKHAGASDHYAGLGKQITSQGNVETEMLVYAHITEAKPCIGSHAFFPVNSSVHGADFLRLQFDLAIALGITELCGYGALSLQQVARTEIDGQVTETVSGTMEWYPSEYQVRVMQPGPGGRPRRVIPICAYDLLLYGMKPAPTSRPN